MLYLKRLINQQHQDGIVPCVTLLYCITLMNKMNTTNGMIRTAHRNHVYLMDFTEYIFRMQGKYYSMDDVQKAVNGFAPIEEINAFFDKFTLAFGKWLLNRHPRTLEHPMEELLKAFRDYLDEASDSEQV